MTSFLYEGWVRHRRTAPTQHSFRYRVVMLYLDLGELDRAFAGSRLFSVERPGVASFRRSDHLGDPNVPLERTVRDLVEARTGARPTGPIRLLTHPRYFGYVMNPVSFFYCFEDDGVTLRDVVAEVNNTPWGERHAYVLGDADNLGGEVTKQFRFRKDFHVSPFMSMDLDYDWRFVTPGERLAVHMTNRDGDRELFDATMVMERRPMTPATLRRAVWRYPLMTARVVGAIYWQALRLRLKGTPYFEHPEPTPKQTARRAEPHS